VIFVLIDMTLYFWGLSNITQIQTYPCPRPRRLKPAATVSLEFYHPWLSFFAVWYSA